MTLVSDGDIVRGLGFVTLYAAYLEEQVDALLELLSSIEPFPDKEKHWPISQRLEKAIRLVRGINSAELNELQEDLESCKALFKRRNEVVHGRIYSGYGRSENAQLMSGRSDVPSREVTPEELYGLANEFDEYQSAVRRPQLFYLPGILAKNNDS